MLMAVAMLVAAETGGFASKANKWQKWRNISLLSSMFRGKAASAWWRRSMLGIY